MKTLYSSLRRKIATALMLMIASVSIAQTDVLVIGAASPQSWLDDVQNKLVATGQFNTVTTYNSYSTGTPSLAYMQGFDAILVYTDYGAQDPVTLGNNLAQYVDGGGGVVSATFTNASVLITGNWNTATYQVCIPNSGQNSSPQLTLGTIHPVCNPIMQGINTFDGGSSSYRSTSSAFTTGSYLVADWSNGEWLVAARENVGPMNARRVDLNFYPPSSDVRSDFWQSTTDGGMLMARSLLWAAGVINGAAPAMPGAITASSSMCPGGSYSASIANVSGATSYTWTVPGGATIQSGQGTNTIYIQPGTTSGNITVTADNACGTSAAQTFAYTTYTPPTVVANATSTNVCYGSSVTLTGSGANSYVWSDSVVDGVPFNVMMTDTFTLIGIDANNCEDTTSIIITALALPPVTGTVSDQEVCANDTVIFNGIGAMTYTWTNGVMDGMSYIITSGGDYIVTGTDMNGCMNADTVNMIVHTLPMVTVALPITTICLDDAALTLSGESPAGGTWSGTGVSGSTFDPSVSGAGSFGIDYMYTDANGCSATATDSVTVDLCLGLNETALTAAEMYPNPNNGTFSIVMNQDAENVLIEVTDVQGRVVYSSNNQDVTAGTILFVNMENNAQGIYMVRVIADNNQQTGRVSVQ